MYVIKNGTLLTMEAEGTLKADILVDQGKIVKISENIDESGMEVIDASGMYITPGFVDAHSHIGGFTDGMDNADLNEMTNPLTPELDAFYGIDPSCKDFEAAIAQGITTSCLVPGSANVVCGWGFVKKSAGRDSVILRPAAMKAAMGINPKGCYSRKGTAPMTRMGIANLLKTYLRNVKEYMEKKAAAEKDASKMPAYDLGLEHGIPVLEKKIPLKVHSYMHDMMTLLEIAKEFDILVTMDHALGASDFVEELKDPHVKGVIFGPTAEPLFGGEGGKLDYECCRLLDDASVPVCVMTDGPVTVVNMLIYEIGEAVRHGMDPDKALKLVTINPARILDIDDRVGSLKVGKDADILLWTGHPARDIDCNLKRVIINGETFLTA